MKVIVHVASSCIDNGRPSQRASCAIRAKAVDESGRTKSRLIVRPLGGKTANQAELYGLLGGIMVVRPMYRNQTEIEVRTNGKYALKCVERDGKVFKTKPVNNVALVDRIRGLLEKHPYVKVVEGDDPDLQTLAKTNVNAKTSIDSGTQG